MSARKALYETLLKRYGISGLTKEDWFIGGNTLYVNPKGLSSNFRIRDNDPYILTQARAAKGELSELKESDRGFFINRLYGLTVSFGKDMTYEQVLKLNESRSVREIADDVYLLEKIKGVDIDPERYGNFLKIKANKAILDEAILMTQQGLDVENLPLSDPVLYEQFDRMTTDDLIQLLVLRLDPNKVEELLFNSYSEL